MGVPAARSIRHATVTELQQNRPTGRGGPPFFRDTKQMKLNLSRLSVALLLAGAAGGANAQVVISQVYGGGGNSGATLKSDFIELHNNGSTAVNLTGWHVAYASATGTSWLQRASMPVFAIPCMPRSGYRRSRSRC